MDRAGPTVLPAADPASLDAAAEALGAGGIVGIPTETVYGLAVMPTDDGSRRLLAAKRRPAEKGIALLVDSVGQVEALADLPPAARRLVGRLWPGPLTVVLAPREGMALPAALHGPGGGLGFRLPDHPVPRALAARLGPIALTSANLTGQPDALTAEDLVRALGPSLALVIDDGRVRGGVPSTVVVIDRDGGARITRQGAVAASSVLAALR